MVEHAVREARTYAKVGLVFYLLTSGLALLAILAFSLFMHIPRMGIPNFIMLFPLLGFSVVFGLTYLAWITVKHIERGRYEAARTNSLILGIIGLVFGMLLGGIFFLLSYNSLGHAVHSPGHLRICSSCGKELAINSVFCSHCGKKLTE